MIFACCAWKIDRKTVMDILEQAIDELVGEASTGCFIVTLHEPMGSDDALAIDPHRSGQRLDMCGGMWSPFALDIALDILKKNGHVEIANLPDGLIRHFLLESSLRAWSAQTLLAELPKL